MESADRISRVLLAFASGEPDLGVTEIARRLGIPKSAVYRTLTALCRSGLVERDRTVPRYRLGPRAVELGLAVLGRGDVRSVALPIMQDVTTHTNETTTLSLLAGSERMYIAQVESPQDVRMTIEIGRRWPLYAGASGLAILAFLAQPEIDEYLSQTELKRLTASTVTTASRLRSRLKRIKEDGYAASSGERDPWAASVAAPILASGNRVIGSISVCGPIDRIRANQVTIFSSTIIDAATWLSQELSGSSRLDAEA
jgi:DNA-binding IclR family transcriptional regulator